MEIVDYTALHNDVLAVAVKREPNHWCAYIKAVPGDSHEREKEEVARHGGKLSEKIALAIFPQFKGTPYAW